MIPGSANPLLLASAGGTPPAPSYAISRSLRFNSSDSAYLGRTPSTAGNRKTWTWAGWVKRHLTGSYDHLMRTTNGSVETAVRFPLNDTIEVYAYNSGFLFQVVTSSLYRDPSAWYHVVCAVDTTQAVAADRVKIYVNGVQVTAFSIATYPTQNFDTSFNQTFLHAIGSTTTPSFFADCYLADIHFIDGQALDPTSFGEFDSNGIWQPIEFTPQATPNDGTTWSNTTNASLTIVDGVTGIFDGSLATRGGAPSTNTNYNTLFSGASISCASGVRIYWNGVGAGQRYIRINDTVEIDNGSAQLTPGWTALSSFSGTINKLEVKTAATGSWAISAVEIDGVILIDGDTSNIGVNGFHLPFSDNSTAAALGTDTSGAGNNWTVNNISVAAGAGNDSLVDVPTNGTETDTGLGGEVRGNYATLNPLDVSERYSAGTSSMKNGNLTIDCPSISSNWVAHSTFQIPQSGKWYFETTCDKASSITNGGYVGTLDLYYDHSGNAYTGSWGAYGSSYGAGDVIGVAVDADALEVTFYKNGVSQGLLSSGSPNARFIHIGGTDTTYTANFGQRPFAYPVSGYKSLCTANLPAPVVTKPSEYMDVKLYTGNGSTQTISGLEFSPDLVWIKARVGTVNYVLVDSVRGATAKLNSNTTSGEDTSLTNGYVSALTSDGFTVAQGGGQYPGIETNYNPGTPYTYASWAWDAGSSTVTNSDGSITSQVRANPSAGFSIVSYTGTGANATVGHGLGIAPQLLIVKSRTVAASNWAVWHTALTGTEYLLLNTTGAKATLASAWNSTVPTSTVFSLGTDPGVNNNGASQIAYCFAPVDGYTSMSSYTGNGSADGPFVFTNMRPRWILIKRTDTTSNWTIIDTAREGYNVDNDPLFPNLSNAEGTTDLADILSNGFKLRTTDASVNANTGTYIYFAIAEAAFNYSRAR